MILLDTSVLSLAFRRREARAEPPAVLLLRRLIADDVPVALPGIVLQELLSGVRRQAEFERLKRLLDPFPVVLAEHTHHVSAARISNACRGVGVTVSAIDCLIAAIATSRDAPLLTIDRDFARMAPHCGLRLLGAAARS